MFTPAPDRIEVKPLAKKGVTMDTKDQLVELGEIVSIGSNCNTNSDFRSERGFIFNIGEILAFEGWGCTKISHNGEEKWLVKNDSNVILGKYGKE